MRAAASHDHSALSPPRRCETVANCSRIPLMLAGSPLRVMSRRAHMATRAVSLIGFAIGFPLLGCGLIGPDHPTLSGDPGAEGGGIGRVDSLGAGHGEQALGWR